MTRYYVISPEFSIDRVEYGHDVIEVEARTKREARVLAVRQMRVDARLGEKNWIDYIGWDTNPFTGLVVEPIYEEVNENGTATDHIVCTESEDKSIGST